jgi:hypothetical protein
MTMLLTTVLGLCVYPTTFDDIAGTLFGEGAVLVALIIGFFLLFDFFDLKRRYHRIFLGLLALQCVGVFVLAYITSRNYLLCAGIPGASPALIQSAEAHYQVLLTFQNLEIVAHIVTISLVIIGVGMIALRWSNRRSRQSENVYL